MSCRHCQGEECHTHTKGIVVYHPETACPTVQAMCRELLDLKEEEETPKTFSPMKWLKELL